MINNIYITKKEVIVQNNPIDKTYFFIILGIIIIFIVSVFLFLHFYSDFFKITKEMAVKEKSPEEKLILKKKIFLASLMNDLANDKGFFKKNFSELRLDFAEGNALEIHEIFYNNINQLKFFIFYDKDVTPDLSQFQMKKNENLKIKNQENYLKLENIITNLMEILLTKTFTNTTLIRKGKIFVSHDLNFNNKILDLLIEACELQIAIQ
jgi:hypothetical protein